MRIFTVLFIFALNGLSLAQMQGSANALPPLSYKISLFKTDKKNKSIVIKLCIFNASDQNVVVDKNAVRYKVTFEKKAVHLPGGGLGSSEALTTTGDPSSEYRGNFVLLHPKENYSENRSLSIDDGFFEKGGEFTVSLTYGFFRDDHFDGLAVWRGSIASNEIVFKK